MLQSSSSVYINAPLEQRFKQWLCPRPQTSRPETCDLRDCSSRSRLQRSQRSQRSTRCSQFIFALADSSMMVVAVSQVSSVRVKSSGEKAQRSFWLCGRFPAHPSVPGGFPVSQMADRMSPSRRGTETIGHDELHQSNLHQLGDFDPFALDDVRLRPLPERRRTHTARPADASEDSSDAYRQADLAVSFCSLLVRRCCTKPCRPGRRSESLFFLGPHTRTYIDC